MLTEAVAIKETGPKETIAKFGEVYAWSPTFIAVRREEPTMLTFWNLQPDDEHDFMLAAPDATVLMHLKLKPLSKNSWMFNFHKEGIFHVLLRGASARDERANPGAATRQREVRPICSAGFATGRRGVKRSTVRRWPSTAMTS